MDFVRLLIFWKAYLLSPCTSERQDVQRVKVIRLHEIGKTISDNLLKPSSTLFFVFFFRTYTNTVSTLSFSFLQYFSFVKGLKATERQEAFTAPWTEPSCHKNNQTEEDSVESIILWWMRAIQFKWFCSLYTPFIQTRFSHRPQLLFDLLLWTLCQKWFNFTLWINNTWCSPSHSRLMARHCIYNAIDNIEQYWWHGRISTSGSGQEWSAIFYLFF